MTPERRRLALAASQRALKVRQTAGIPMDQPCSVYDLAEQLGIQVRFAPIPSAEGIYSPNKPVIILSSLRPPGRQAFTCAHELGHHIYGHGEQFDELVEERDKSRRFDAKEYEADTFAAALLMPRTALLKGMTARSISPKTASPEQLYALASWLGVGYSTILFQLSTGMKLIDNDEAEALGKIRLPEIRKRFLGRECRDHLIVVDSAWTGRAIDAQVGDVLQLPANTFIEGSAAAAIEEQGSHLVAQATTPGIGRLVSSDGSWAQFIRVSRKQYCGLARFRHLEEVDD